MPNPDQASHPALEWPKKPKVSYPPLNETALLHALQDDRTVDDINAEYQVHKAGLPELGPVFGDGGPAIKEIVIPNQVAQPVLGESVRLIPVETPVKPAVDVHVRIA